EVIGTAGQLAEQNKNRLVVEAQENLGALTVDPMRLRQILLNLLSNACKFTKTGEVKLAARKVSNGSNFVEFAVSDTGIGWVSRDQVRSAHRQRCLSRDLCATVRCKPHATGSDSRVQGAVADCIMTEVGGSFISLNTASVSAFISRANIAANPPTSRFDL